MKLIFYSSIFILIYVYFLYPFSLWVISKISNRNFEKQNLLLPVTIIITAYNEERNIKKTILNKLRLVYPKNLMEVIVVSDGSNDETDKIVQSIKDPRVKLIRQNPRSGKTAALNLAVSEAKGEIIIFSDANSDFEKNVLIHLIDSFSDMKVGYVTGKMIYVNENGSIIGDGCSTYMKYENLLRSLETKIGSIVGVDGGIDAMKKSLYVNMRPDQLPDFILPLKVVEQGYRVIYEPQAILREETLNDVKSEFKMRIRVSLRAFWAIWDMRNILNINKFKLYSWQLFSHKLLRYFVFLFLILLFSSNLFLLNEGGFFILLFSLQSIFYLFALLGFALDRLKFKTKLFYIPYYFSLINCAAGIAFIKFLFRKKQIMWQPRIG